MRLLKDDHKDFTYPDNGSTDITITSNNDNGGNTDVESVPTLTATTTVKLQ